MERPKLPESFEILSSREGCGQNCHYVIRTPDAIEWNVGTTEYVTIDLAQTPEELRGRQIEFINQRLQ